MDGKSLSLAERMIRYRAQHNLSQEKFAKLVGVSLQTINSIETGSQEPSKITVAKIELAMEKQDVDV